MRPLFSCPLLALALLVTSGPGAYAVPHEGAEFSDALERYRQGDTDATARILQARQAQELAASDRIDTFLLLSRVFWEDRRYEEALEVSAAALSDPDVTTALDDHLHIIAARSHVALGDPAAALPHLKSVSAHVYTPFQSEAAFLKARCLHALGETRQARRAYDKVIADWPDSVEARNARPQRAALYLSRLLGHDPARRRAPAVTDKHLEIIEDLRLLVRMAPDSEAASEARSLLNQLAERGTDGAPSERRLVVAELEWLVSERRFVEAIPRLQKLRREAAEARHRSMEIAMVELLARSMYHSHRYAEALTLYRWLEGKGRRVASHRRMAELLAHTGDHEGAEALLLQKHHRKKRKAYWKDVARHRLAFGQYDGALAAFLKQRPKRARRVNLRLAKKIAWCLLLSGRHEEAAEAFTELRVRTARDRGYARYWEARALQMAGREAEALQRFDSLHGQRPLEYYGILASSRALEIRGHVTPVLSPEGRTGSGFGSTSTASPPTAASGVSGSPPRDGEAPPRVRTDGTQLAEVMGQSLEGSAPAAAMSILPPSSLAWPEDLRRGAAYGLALKPTPRDEFLAVLTRFADAWGHLAPEAHRAVALARLDLTSEAQEELRVIASDLRALKRRGARALTKRGRSNLLDNRADKRARGGLHLRRNGRRTSKASRAFAKATREGLTEDLRQAQLSLGDAHGSRRIGLRQGMGRVPEAARAEAWSSVYPIAWPALVSTFARLHELPPYLIYAVMTVESAFHPHAVSVSHAYGLLQMIPKTGRRVAMALGYGEFTPEALLKPEVSIYMGTHYLASLLRKFQGQEALAAAAYNCGPHRVQSWLLQNPHRSMDVFVDEIPYRQTEGYAKSVLENVARYRRIYHGEELVYVSNHLDDRTLAAPNF